MQISDSSVTIGNSELTKLIRHLLLGGEVNFAANLALLMARENTLEVLELLSVADRLTSLGRRDISILLYKTWVAGESSPIAYVAYFNLGILLSDSGDLSGAELAYRKALAIKPDFVQASLNLGTLLERAGRKNEALSSWRSVIDSFSVEVATPVLYLHALNNLGRLLEHLGRYDEAESMLERSLLLDGNQPDVIQHWVHLRQKQCKWPVYRDVEGLSRDFMVEYTSPLAMLSASDDPELQLKAAHTFVRRKVNTQLPVLAPRQGYQHSKLRIGYLSSDYCLHPVSLLTVQLYELHDREQFEVFAFSWSREDGSSLRARVVQAMDKYICITDMSDEEAARCIREYEIDILIDLQGLTSGARPNILSYRPAPMQIAYLGYPGTTGLPNIDYVIADRYVLPDTLAPFFSEKPLYMPETFQISDRKREIAPKPTRSECGLPEDAFVFCSFNNNFKFSEPFFATWMRILKAVPDSVLWLLADNVWARESMCRTAEAHGVDVQRLIFAPRVAPPVYLARYQLADLFLDTSPFNAGTTANDALWMGLPLLTSPGRTFASRMAGSLLTTLGLPELIATTLDVYEQTAIELARDPEHLQELRSRLLSSRENSPQFDSPRFVRHLESLLQQTYTQDVSGCVME